MVQVYSEPICRRHYSGLFSFAVIVRLIFLFGSIAVSIVVAYATGGFWVKIRPTIDQPNVQYTNQALLLFEGSTPGEEMIWSNSQTISKEFPDHFIPANVQVGSADTNFDGKPDILTFVVRVQSQRPVYGVKALFQLTYDFDSSVQLQMYTFAYLAYSSPTPGGTLYTDGELVLNQKSPITDRRFNGLYNTPMLDFSTPSVLQASQASSMLQFETILRSYLSHNYTTTYTNNFPVWKAGPGTSFILNMVVRIPAEQIIWYRPQVIEMLKFAWIQFLATFIVLWWFYSYLEVFIFHHRLVDTRIASDLHAKAGKF